MASVYQRAINCTKERTGTGMGVRWRAATTMPTRNVMARKRTRPSQESHSLTLGVDFISDFSPRYWREPRHVRLAPELSGTRILPRRGNLPAHPQAPCSPVCGAGEAPDGYGPEPHGF